MGFIHHFCYPLNYFQIPSIQKHIHLGMRVNHEVLVNIPAVQKLWLTILGHPRLWKSIGRDDGDIVEAQVRAEKQRLKESSAGVRSTNHH